MKRRDLQLPLDTTHGGLAERGRLSSFRVQNGTAPDILQDIKFSRLRPPRRSPPNMGRLSNFQPLECKISQ
jgi:hypothetical protein